MAKIVLDQVSKVFGNEVIAVIKTGMVFSAPHLSRECCEEHHRKGKKLTDNDGRIQQPSLQPSSSPTVLTSDWIDGVVASRPS